MERRILNALLSFAHFFLAVAAVSVGTVVVYGLFAALVSASGTPPEAPSVWLVLAPALLVLFAWWILLQIYGRVQLRTVSRDAMSGRFAEASERIRRFQDREPWLRLAGLGGAVWAQARMVDAYNRYLHGLSADAISLALPLTDSRLRPVTARSSALVVAGAAADVGDLHAFDLLARWMERAHAQPQLPWSQQVLTLEGQAFAMQLVLDRAAERAEWLLGLGGDGRLGRTLRANVRTARGEFAAALEDLEAALASPSLSKGTAAQREFTRQLLESGKALALVELRRDAEALAIAERHLAEGVRHRNVLVASHAIRGVVAARGTAPDRVAVAEKALAELAAIRASFDFQPVVRARVSIATAQIERALGRPDRASAGLGDAIAAPVASLRQIGLHEQAEAREALGDAAGARQSREFLLQIPGETFVAAQARARLGASANVPA